MPELVEFRLADGSTVLVQADPAAADDGPSGPAMRGFRDRFSGDAADGGVAVRQAERGFEQAVQSVRPVAEALVDQLRTLAGGPQEVTIEFGLQMSAQAGAFIAHVASAANFIEWATPVLYTRAADTRVFTVAPAAGPAGRPPGIPAAAEAVRPGAEAIDDSAAPEETSADTERDQPSVDDGRSPEASAETEPDQASADDGQPSEASGAGPAEAAPTARRAAVVGYVQRALAPAAVGCLLLSLVVQPFRVPAQITDLLSRYTTPWAWAAAVAAVLSVVTTLGVRERAVVRGATLGVAAGLLGMLTVFPSVLDVLFRDGSSAILEHMRARITLMEVGAVLALVSVLLEVLTRPGRGWRMKAWTVTAVALLPMLIRIYASGPDLDFAVVTGVLAVVAIACVVRRRRTEPRPAAAFGVAVLAVLLAATGFSLGRGDYDVVVYISGATTLALTAIFFPEQERFLLLATRLSIAAGLFVTSLVLGGDYTVGHKSLSSGWRDLAAVGVAGFAGAAAYASRPRLAVPGGPGTPPGSDPDPVAPTDPAVRRRRRLIGVMSSVTVVLIGAVTAIVIDATREDHGSAGSATSSGGSRPLLRGAAVSADGRRLFVATPNGLRVVDTTTDKAATIPLALGSGPVGLAADRKGHRLYLTGGSAAGNVTVFDTDTNTVLDSQITTGETATALAISADGSRLYVAHPDSDHIAVIDVATGSAVGELIGIAGRPDALAISADGRRLDVASLEAGVFVVDLTSGDTLEHLSVADLGMTSGGPTGIAAGAGNQHVYISNADSHAVQALLEAPAATNGLYLAMGGDLLDVPWSPGSAAVSPDGTRLYVVSYHADAVAVFDTASNAGVGQPFSVTAGPTPNVSS